MFVCGIYTACDIYLYTSGIDFYQFWGVGKVHNLSSGALKSPYNEMHKYAAMIDDLAHSSDDLRIRLANQINHRFYKEGIDLIGTPLIFSIFALMPQNYSLAYGIYELTLLFSFISGCLLIFLLHNNKWCIFSLLALLLTINYAPFIADLTVGNISSIQFLLFTLITSLIKFTLKNSQYKHNYIISSVIMCSLVFLLLLKPNMLILVLLLSASIWSLQGAAVFTVSSAIASLFGVALIYLSGEYFDSPAIWLDWLNVFSRGSEKLSYPISNGNFSAVQIISQFFDVRVNVTILSVFSILSLITLLVLFKTIDANYTVFRGLFKSTVSVLKEPFLCSAIGVTLTLAISPLVWVQYNVILLLPALWFILDSRPWSITELSAILSILMSSGTLSKILQSNVLEPYFIAFGWVPILVCIWVGIIEINNKTETLIAN